MDRTCSVEGCERKLLGRGLCELHYHRMRRHGSIADPRLARQRSCSVEGCDRKFYGNGMCNLHYCRVKRNGSVETLAELRKKQVCSVVECDRKLYARSLCQLHWGRVRKYGSTDKRPRIGVKHTAESRAKIAASKVGAKNHRYGRTEEQSRNWKGDAVGYCGVHDWMTSRYGQPKHCEECGSTDPRKRYEWANISGEYRRDRADFKRLCKRCHNQMDCVNAYQLDAPPRRNRPIKAIKGKPVSSRYKGVTASGYGGWLARLKVNGKAMHLGTFKTEEEAARAYDTAVREAYGEDAYLNEIGQQPCA